jgi:hypothetical protein
MQAADLSSTDLGWADLAVADMRSADAAETDSAFDAPFAGDLGVDMNFLDLDFGTPDLGVDLGAVDMGTDLGPASVDAGVVCTTDADCGDLFACTTDQCTSGVCVHTPVNLACADTNPCTIDTCTTSTRGGCRHSAASAGLRCSDGTACTTGDHCNGNSFAPACVGTATCPGVRMRRHQRRVRPLRVVRYATKRASSTLR